MRYGCLQDRHMEGQGDLFGNKPAATWQMEVYRRITSPVAMVVDLCYIEDHIMAGNILIPSMIKDL